MPIHAPEIQKSLAAHRPQTADLLPGLTPAAVLVPFYLHPDGPALIFTKRTETVDSHKGQISFPGGHRDEEDRDVIATALREAQEEIGLAPGDVTIWGRLNQQVTVTGFSVAPIVGAVPYPYEFRLSSVEVERLIVAPLAHLMDPRHQSQEYYPWQGRNYLTYQFAYNGDIIWGATARMVHNLITLLTTGQEPSDEELIRNLEGRIPAAAGVRNARPGR